MMHDPDLIRLLAGHLVQALTASNASNPRMVVEAVLATLCAARPDVAALLAGEAVAVPRGAIEAWRKRDAHHPIVAAAIRARRDA